MLLAKNKWFHIIDGSLSDSPFLSHFQMRKEKLQRNKLRRHLFGDSLGAVIYPDLQNIEIFRFVSFANCVWNLFKIFPTLYSKCIDELHYYHIPAASNNLIECGSPPIITVTAWLSDTWKRTWQSNWIDRIISMSIATDGI